MSSATIQLLAAGQIGEFLGEVVDAEHHALGVVDVQRRVLRRRRQRHRRIITAPHDALPKNSGIGTWSTSTREKTAVAGGRRRRAADEAFAHIGATEHRVGQQLRRATADVEQRVEAEPRLADAVERPVEAHVEHGVRRLFQLDDAPRQLQVGDPVSNGVLVTAVIGSRTEKRWAVRAIASNWRSNCSQSACAGVVAGRWSGTATTSKEGQAV